MGKKFRLILLILAGLVIVAFGFFAWAAIDPIRYRNLAVNDVDLKNLPDGVYEGFFKGGRFSNSVEVTLKDHRILEIKTVKSAIPMKELYEKIYARVIEEQSLAIDTVSGATVTTKTALKAIENALSE